MLRFAFYLIFSESLLISLNEQFIGIRIDRHGNIRRTAVPVRLSPKVLAGIYLYLPTQWTDFQEVTDHLDTLPDHPMCSVMSTCLKEKSANFQSTAKEFLVRLAEKHDEKEAAADQESEDDEVIEIDTAKIPRIENEETESASQKMSKKFARLYNSQENGQQEKIIPSNIEVEMERYEALRSDGPWNNCKLLDHNLFLLF